MFLKTSLLFTHLSQSEFFDYIQVYKRLQVHKRSDTSDTAHLGLLSQKIRHWYLNRNRDSYTIEARVRPRVRVFDSPSVGWDANSRGAMKRREQVSQPDAHACMKCGGSALEMHPGAINALEDVGDRFVILIAFLAHIHRRRPRSIAVSNWVKAPWASWMPKFLRCRMVGIIIINCS